jgi:hypothetical protein
MQFRVFAEEFFSYVIPGALLFFVAGLIVNFSTDLHPAWLFESPWRWITISGLVLASYFIGHFAQTLVGPLTARAQKETSENSPEGQDYGHFFFRQSNTDVTPEFKARILNRFAGHFGFLPAGIASDNDQLCKNAASEVLALCKSAVLQDGEDHDIRRLDALYGMYGGICGVLPLLSFLLVLGLAKEVVDSMFTTWIFDGRLSWGILAGYALLVFLIGYAGLPIARKRYSLFVHKYIEQIFVDFLAISRPQDLPGEVVERVAVIDVAAHGKT